MTDRLPDTSPTVGSVARAWGVHAFTASGAVVGVAALRACGAGDLRTAALWMLVAIAIDAVDGTLARRARVSEVLPRIDGRRLDDIVDYLNYVVVPAVFLLQAEALLLGPAAAAAMVLSSAYGFSQDDAKSADHFFVGFPSYWNVVAIYLWWLELPPALGTALVALLAAAVFVPLRYVYPSRLSVLWWTTNAGAALWLVVLGLALGLPEAFAGVPLVLLSMLYPAYYLALSFWLGGVQRRGRRAGARAPSAGDP